MSLGRGAGVVRRASRAGVARIDAVSARAEAVGGVVRSRRPTGERPQLGEISSSSGRAPASTSTTAGSAATTIRATASAGPAGSIGT